MSLLIHSMSEFSGLILSALELAECKSVIEIGTEAGGMTSHLLEYAKREQGWMTSIDPRPRPEAERLLNGTPFGTLYRDTSLRALPKCPPADAYLVDGDHNYYTVLHELVYIQRAQAAKGRPLLVFLHDVCWPCARRDMYYNPPSIPGEWLHEHTWTQGITLDNPGVVEGAYRGGGQFAWALHEGGPGNGVLTAIEDFLSATEGDYRLAVVPAVFGLGVLYEKCAPWAQALERLLHPHDNALLRILERNRLENYLRVIDLEDLEAARQAMANPETTEC